jgi:hypothetical protein
VKVGRTRALEAWLEEHAALVNTGFWHVGSLHAARFVVLHAEPASRAGIAKGTEAEGARLVFESTFDGELGRHLGELWQHAGARLEPLLSHCEGFEVPASAASFARYVQKYRREAAAFFCAYPALSVARVRADARLRLAVGRYLDAHFDELAELGPGEVVARLTHSLVQDHRGFDLERVAPSPPLPDRAAVLRRHAFELGRTFLRGLVHDLSDWLGGLWALAGEPAAPQHGERLEPAVWSERSDRPRRAERTLGPGHATLAVSVKAGGFRRAALRLGWRVADALGGALAASDRAGHAGTHAARSVALGDGRFLLSSSFDGSLEAFVGARWARARTWLALFGSNLRGFPATFAWVLGGDRASVTRWAEAHAVPALLAYSAYPGLSAREVVSNAALREIFAGNPDDASARRALEMLRD